MRKLFGGMVLAALALSLPAAASAQRRAAAPMGALSTSLVWTLDSRT